MRRGDRVALLLHNGLEFVESLLACHLLGAVAVPVNFRLAPDEIAYILRDSGAVALIADAGSPSLGRRPGSCSRRDRAPTRTRRGGRRPPGAGVRCARTTRRSCATRPGTTGRPKGAVLTHGNLVASTLSWIHEMRAGPDDVWLSGQPLFHIGGINGLLPFLALGATCIVTPTHRLRPRRRRSS